MPVANHINRTHEKHGYTKTPTYQAWVSMKMRCYTHSATGYERYGGRGIQVCDRWLHSFANFLADMGERPTGMCGKVAMYSLERLDNNGNYEPSNCVWAARGVQMKNRRKWRFIDGPTKRQQLHEVRGIRKELQATLAAKLESLQKHMPLPDAYRRIVDFLKTLKD